MGDSHHLAQRLSYDGDRCTVRYVGPVEGASGSWLGVEWDDPSRGKHDGSHKAIRYFTCLSKSRTAASFIRPTRPADEPRSFASAIRYKYASETAGNGPASTGQIVISGKVAEEVGFDHVRRKLAQLQELKIVILDGMRIDCAAREGEDSVADTCPRVVQLDLSRNLFESLIPIMCICRDLSALRKLSLNGNRFRTVSEASTVQEDQKCFRDVQELALDDTLLSWVDICYIASKSECLASLSVGANQLSVLPRLDYPALSGTLTTLAMEYNDFSALSDLANITSLTALRNLNLKGNNISELAAPGDSPPIFPPALHFLDISYNAIHSWSFIDQLPTCLPGLTALRLAHNPVYDTPDPNAKAASSEEAHMITIARLAPLTSLNFTQIHGADRTNAEVFYLSRIAKQLATVPESAEASVIELHPRYAELCELHGAPDVIRRDDINPSFLEARLLTVDFHGQGKGKRTARIPKTFDIYAVKGIAGKLFDLPAMKARLFWETGEWDPVERFDEGEEGSSDDEGSAVADGAAVDHAREAFGQERQSGHWVKREVELADGPRQLGYCVDGAYVVIRVECG